MPRFVLLPTASLAILLAACGGAPAASSEAPSSPTASAAASPTDSPSGAPSASAAPSESAEAASGIALVDVDHEALLDAFASFGFTIEPEPNDLDGANVWVGTAEGGDVELNVREVDGDIDTVAVYDYSAGEAGLEELGFLIGIFAPEAESWLVEHAEMAVADPGTAIEAEMEFEHVKLVFEAYTDDTQSIDLYVVEK
jgi:hypothetical protein